ncbi:hypothetical protein [Haloplanus sp. C73]|uniref:hypothetical protein n=1 Tax=Haloplanus sp. C73 TaxID=3421641 RepID=UPI003EBC5755
MAPTGFPTGTVSSGRDGSATGSGPARDTDPQTRIAELERENEALRAAVEEQRRENERIVERYERLLDECEGEVAPQTETDTPADAGLVARIARFFGA